MPFKTKLQTAMRKMSSCNKKDQKDNLLEPPLLALPNSPKIEEVYYIIDDFMNLSIGCEMADTDRTYYENDTFDLYIGDDPLRRSTKRKRPGLQKLGVMTPIFTSTPHRLIDENDFDYSPPAKRAPILRRIPLRLDIPKHQPPPLPINEENEEDDADETTYLIPTRMKLRYLINVGLIGFEDAWQQSTYGASAGNEFGRRAESAGQRLARDDKAVTG
ncbi:hypothetical protein Q1695_009896 [Nippostrongylus brasiliensis]|nr:hypothetical protein Q1695_009896 [Nippostrongylus brasiliensis]